MSGADEHMNPGPRVQAAALARALRNEGLAAMVLVKGGHQFHPCVLIAPGPGQDAADCVYAAPDYAADPGTWWFWWSWLEPIAPVTDITASAAEITAAFARLRDPLPATAALA
jgi:hypothetical protein